MMVEVENGRSENQDVTQEESRGAVCKWKRKVEMFFQLLASLSNRRGAKRCKFAPF